VRRDDAPLSPWSKNMPRTANEPNGLGIRPIMAFDAPRAATRVPTGTFSSL
jgi:hypothetical protein